MNMPRARRGTRLLLVALGAAVAVLTLWAAGALALFPVDNVTSYAGCLNINASPGGTFSNVAVGDAPSKPCGNGQALVHLSGGDITSVNAGTGLTGGSTNGAATLSLAGGQALPQTCTASQVPKWDTASKTWLCGNDNNTTYSNGTGLDLSAGNAFSIDPGYQLPQGCNSGQLVASGGSNTWSCTSSVVSGVTTYNITFSGGVDSFYSTRTLGYNCNQGDVVTGGGFDTDNVDIKASGPNGNNGWYVRADGGLEGGSVTLSVMCLHITH